MVTIAESIIGDSSAAEDLAQEALSRAHDRWGTISHYDKPGAWVRRVTINLALSSRRRLQREAKALLKTRRQLTPAEHDDSASGLSGPVWEALESLSARQRAVVALFYLEDRPVDEIAELCGMSISATTSHLSVARRRLRTLLEGEASER